MNKMKTKILIILIGLGVGGFFLYKNITTPEVEEGVVPAPSNEVQVYKGIWTPMPLTEDPNKLASDMQKLKDIGVNTIFFSSLSLQQIESCFERLPSEAVEKIKEILPIRKELLIANIQTAHRNGLKVALTMGKCIPKSREIDLEAWNSEIIEYAKIAEEYEVEFFAPMNEPEVQFGPSASATWGQEILPKIKEVYHGKIIWKGDAIGGMQPDPGQPHPTNFSGYDYLGFTIGLGPGVTLEEFSQRVDYDLNRAFAFAERDNVKGVMITEFYGRLPEEWESEAWSEEKEARTHEIVLERGKDKVVGFFALDFLGLDFLGREFPGIPAREKALKTEEVIKKWFTEILK